MTTLDSVQRPTQTTDFGRLLRVRRARARLSQLELAVRADVSQRHLSFIETGRARPRADVVRRLGEALELPLRDRNGLLAAAGLPAVYPEARSDDRAIAPFRLAVRRMLEAHEPYPALVLDRWWDVVEVNAAARRLFPEAAGATSNAIELFLGPAGIRNMVVNFAEVAGMYLRRLEAEVAATPDDRSQAVLARARSLLADVPIGPATQTDDLVICPKLRIGDEIVGTVTMVARFGAPREVTLDELRVELVFPADEAADAVFRRLATES